MNRYTMKRFASDPLVTASAQFGLGRPTPIGADEPMATVARPWGLRELIPAVAGPELPAVRYNHVSQLTVIDDGTGRAFVDVVKGPPTAPTTQPTDGEDPPSSEDWKNDFAPDDPACPF